MAALEHRMFKAKIEALHFRTRLRRGCTKCEPFSAAVRAVSSEAAREDVCWGKHNDTNNDGEGSRARATREPSQTRLRVTSSTPSVSAH